MFGPKKNDTNMERMRNLLTYCKLEEYADLFEHLGFDDVESVPYEYTGPMRSCAVLMCHAMYKVCEGQSSNMSAQEYC